MVINKYDITNETKIPIKKLKKIAENPPYYRRRKLRLYQVMYGIFHNDSYIPSKISIISLNSIDYKEKNIIVHKNETVKILLFMKRKIQYRTISEDGPGDSKDEPSSEELNFFTEDLLCGNIYI